MTTTCPYRRAEDHAPCTGAVGHPQPHMFSDKPLEEWTASNFFVWFHDLPKPLSALSPDLQDALWIRIGVLLGYTLRLEGTIDATSTRLGRLITTMDALHQLRTPANRP